MSIDKITDEKGTISSNYRYSLVNMNNNKEVKDYQEQNLAPANMSYKSSNPYGQTSIHMHSDLKKQGKSIPNKYPNIKPAISIKPKPVPIAVSKPNNPVISNFDMNSKSTLKNDISLNIILQGSGFYHQDPGLEENQPLMPMIQALTSLIVLA